MFVHGNMPNSSKSKGDFIDKPSPSPAHSSSCVEPSPRSCSSASESSLVSPAHDSRSKDKRAHTPATKIDNKDSRLKDKRERSPTNKFEKDFEFKKPRPRPHCPLKREWQIAGNKAAADFVATGPIHQYLITGTRGELENLIPRIMKASDDFRAIFSDSDSSSSI
jgi:hypothetical protein